jgi:hypothetical protein
MNQNQVLKTGKKKIIFKNNETKKLPKLLVIKVYRY